ncbi:MAG TPA: zinc ribbon domain-containing protein [Baekduia sp.]|uniref:zinc ribbon domain-containing protein n=1 Tax=Baekduia sp. TaxID=2600305 RepID=UPI002D7960F0|nr:zinc ribbon domain-containing protein [Baekduia sp.]HET6507196.1 zinc ribbon domain-containing protein [Baekduia sp.]
MSLPASNCGECGAALRDDQRYCLRCGARHGAPRVDALAELGFPPAPLAAPSAARADEPLPSGPNTPSRRLTAALAAATLALGGVAGAALGPAPEGAVAGAPPARVLALVVPAAAPATTATDDADQDAGGAADEPDDDGGRSDTPSASSAAAGSDGDGDGDASSTDDPSSSDDDGHGSPTPSSTDDGASSATPSSTAPAGTAPAHVWLVSLPAADAATAFGPASPLAPLVARGLLLGGYSDAGPTPAANQLALLGGQVPTADCAASLPACVRPAGETSLPDQLVAIGLTWRAYVEDATQRCTTGPAARVGPSLFTTLVQRGDCATTTVGTDRLAADLETADATPALSLVVADSDASAKAVADQVLASEAYKKDGVLVLAPDAPAAAPDPTAPAAPAAPVGALVLSPQATAGATDATATGPVALLRSVDGLFGLDPLGAAAQAPAGALDPIFPPSHPSNPTRRSP